MRILLLFIFTAFIGMVYGQELTKEEFKLIQAAESGNSDSVLLLLNKKINVNCKGWDGLTPLHYAVQNGHLRNCKILISNGAMINPIDIDNRSPLLLAVHFNHLEIAEYLIQNKADPNIKDFEGLTPLFYAAAYGDYLLTDMFLFYGGKQKIKDPDGKNPFMVAIWGGYPGIAGLLKKYGADINAVDNLGNSSLALAVKNQDTVSIDSLIRWGANLELETSIGKTALEIAIEQKDTISLKKLIQAGAEVNHEIQEGLVTIDYAHQIRAKDEIIEILENAGATPRKGILLNQINLGVVTLLNKDESRLGLSLNWYDLKYQFGFYGGISQRLKRIQVFYPVNDTLLYLLQETRTSFSLGTYKELPVFRPGNGHQSGLKVYLGTNLSIGGFRASSKNPPARLSAQAQISWYYYDTHLQYEIGYLYQLDGNNSISPSMLTMSVLVPLTPRLL